MAEAHSESDESLGKKPEGTVPERTVAERPGPQMSAMHEIASVAVICSAQLLTQACLAQSIAPMIFITESFGPSAKSYQSWMPAAYSLTVGTFILPAGRLGDVFGYRRMFICGYAWLAVWSVIAGLSVYSGQILFDLGRAFQGVGPALLLPNALAVLGKTYPPGPRKDMVFSIFGSTAPGGFLIGAVFSAMFGQLAWWPWAYWTTAVVVAMLTALAWILIPSSNDEIPNDPGVSTAQRLDIGGAVVGVASLVLINFAWNQGPIDGWPTIYVYVLLIIGALLVPVFFWIESRAARPLLPVHALSRDTGFVLACVAAGWSAFGIWLYYLWQFAIILRHDTPLLMSAYFVPVALSGLCAALTTGKLLGVLPPAIVMLISMTAFTVGSVVLATMPIHRSYWAGIFISCLITPWGMVSTSPFIQHARKSLMRAGHVLSLGLYHSQQCYAARAPRYGSIFGQHCCQLLHFHWPRYGWNGGKPCQPQWPRRFARLSRCMVPWDRTRWSGHGGRFCFPFHQLRAASLTMRKMCRKVFGGLSSLYVESFDKNMRRRRLSTVILGLVSSQFACAVLSCVVFTRHCNPPGWYGHNSYRPLSPVHLFCRKLAVDSSEEFSGLPSECFHWVYHLPTIVDARGANEGTFPRFAQMSNVAAKVIASIDVCALFT